MKKLTAILMALILTLSFTALAEETPAPTADTPESTSNILVVYFSATGNTESAANLIAEATGADVFKLEPAQPYTDADLNWTDENSRVVYEHDNPEERHVELVADTVENWEQYDTVFIGYPIWWGVAAWPVDTFVEANDFTDKTVIRLGRERRIAGGTGRHWRMARRHALFLQRDRGGRAGLAR